MWIVNVICLSCLVGMILLYLWIADKFHNKFHNSKISVEGDRKIVPRNIAPEQILPWVRVRVWVSVRMGGNHTGGNLPGGNIPSTIVEACLEFPFLKYSSRISHVFTMFSCQGGIIEIIRYNVLWSLFIYQMRL